MNNQFFHRKDSISIIGFLSTFKIACSTNRIHEGAAMSTSFTYAAFLN